MTSLIVTNIALGLAVLACIGYVIIKVLFSKKDK